MVEINSDVFHLRFFERTWADSAAILPELAPAISPRIIQSGSSTRRTWSSSVRRVFTNMIIDPCRDESAETWLELEILGVTPRSGDQL